MLSLQPRRRTFDSTSILECVRRYKGCTIYWCRLRPWFTMLWPSLKLKSSRTSSEIVPGLVVHTEAVKTALGKPDQYITVALTKAMLSVAALNLAEQDLQAECVTVAGQEASVVGFSTVSRIRLAW